MHGQCCRDCVPRVHVRGRAGGAPNTYWEGGRGEGKGGERKVREGEKREERASDIVEAHCYVITTGE